MDWEHIAGKRIWYDTLEEAREMVDLTVETDIQGFDIDENALEAARGNARLAGVENIIHFQKRGVDMLSHAKKYGFVITNPPYGERMEEADLPSLYATLGPFMETTSKSKSDKISLISLILPAFPVAKTILLFIPCPPSSTLQAASGLCIDNNRFSSCRYKSFGFYPLSCPYPALHSHKK